MRNTRCHTGFLQHGVEALRGERYAALGFQQRIRSQRPGTSDPQLEHRIHPYLLPDLAITRPGHVWCADITCLPMRRGFLYRVAVMDWTSRKVLAWRLSNTMDAAFRVEALKEALALRQARNLQHGSQAASSPAPTSPTCCAMPERGSAWTDAAADGQCLHRAALAAAEVRVRLPERVRDRLRVADRA